MTKPELLALIIALLLDCQKTDDIEVIKKTFLPL